MDPLLAVLHHLHGRVSQTWHIVQLLDELRSVGWGPQESVCDRVNFVLCWAPGCLPAFTPMGMCK